MQGYRVYRVYGPHECAGFEEVFNFQEVYGVDCYVCLPPARTDLLRSSQWKDSGTEPHTSLDAMSCRCRGWENLESTLLVWGLGLAAKGSNGKPLNPTGLKPCESEAQTALNPRSFLLQGLLP